MRSLKYLVIQGIVFLLLCGSYSWIVLIDGIPVSYPLFLEYAEIAKKSFPDRKVFVSKVLNSVAGVYKNKTLGLSMGLQRSVIMCVAGYNDNGIAHYMVFFKNFLCFAKHYDYDVVLYILHHNIMELQLEIKKLQLMGVTVITYPDELFWRIVATKKTRMHSGRQHGNYSKATKPTFQHFGSLVMLVPILEVLDLGFSVFFFDVDLALIQGYSMFHNNKTLYCFHHHILIVSNLSHNRSHPLYDSWISRLRCLYRDAIMSRVWRIPYIKYC